VGRRQSAEPRWLIPMLCRTGGITKREIGAIKMQPEESFVQIAADWADRFMTAIGPDKKMQGNISVKRLEGLPDLTKAGFTPPPSSDRKPPHRGKPSFDNAAPKRAYEKREKPAFAGDAKPWAGKPKFDKSAAPKNKKPKKKPE
jgi:ATP-dependent RNA helicase DeaD